MMFLFFGEISKESLQPLREAARVDKPQAARCKLT
jgi:hypothetical protein